MSHRPRQTRARTRLNPYRPVAADGPKRPYLIIIAGAHVGEMYKVDGPRTVLGRSPAADIRIVDEGISREHIEILVEGERVRIRDLGSANGTYRNGSRADETEINDGDKISIGSTTILKFSYHDGIDEAYQQGLCLSAVHDRSLAR